MNKVKVLWRVLTHWRELSMALSGLSVRIGGDDAIGGLTPVETAALVDWTRRSGCGTFVEIGTLFGFTAKTIARETQAKVVAVDNFCWNPFGLTPAQHEAFTRRIIEGTSVEIVRGDSLAYLKGLDGRDALVFLDGDHRYAAVKAELEAVKASGVRFVAGHDFGNPNFGVTQAVREVLGEPDETAGMCWFKKCV